LQRKEKFLLIWFVVDKRCVDVFFELCSKPVDEIVSLDDALIEAVEVCLNLGKKRFLISALGFEISFAGVADLFRAE
jgi:hypothetical protein